ncbi:MAG: matrixin family metalloprotease [Deltaproteobacteria bacterium]|nr:matrixin family metalloprotease [Deltaproteobacteria bacterium]
MKNGKIIIFIIITAQLLYSYEREKAEISGKPLKWEKLPIKYHINKFCYKPIDAEKCKEAIVRSFNTWESPKCTSLRFERSEDTEEAKGSFNSLDIKANKNIIVWYYKDWPYEPNGVALTTITYDDKTGEIYDADIELNGVYYRFDVVETLPSTYTDIQNTMTHEIGHMIGLDHNYDPHSVMYPTAKAGEIKKRILSQDDIEGVCDIYREENGCSCSILSY